MRSVPMAALTLALAALPARGSYVEVTPTNYNFGEVAVGASSVRLFTVTNVKNSNQDRSITITDQSVSGTDFVLGSARCPATLAITQSCQVGVVFKPTATGSRTGTFTLRSTGGEFIRTLAGFGQSAVSVAPTSVDFGRVKIGETESASVVVSNLTNSDYFTITAAGGPNFPIGNSSGTIGPHESATISITFKPLAEGSLSESMTVSWRSTTGSGVAGSISVVVVGSGYTPSSSGGSDPLDVGGCLVVATASGSAALESQLPALRQVRDVYLLTDRVPFGRRFVAGYYALSPPVAQFIARNPPARTAARAVLTPVLLTVNHPLGALGLLLGGVAAGVALRRRAGR